MKKAVLLIALVLVTLAALALPSFAADTYGDIERFGGSVTVPKDETVHGTVSVTGGNVVVDGRVTENVEVYGGNVTINGRVDGIVSNVGGNTTFGDKAYVGGSFTHFGGNVDKAPGATIRGGESTWGPFGDGGPFDGFSPFGWFLSSLIGIVLAAGLATLVVALLPGPTAMLARTVEEQPLQSLGYGTLATVLIPVLFIALALLIIVGWVMIPFVALAIPLIYGYGLVGVSRWLGERVIAATKFAQDSPIAQVLTGSVLLGIINLVPIVGWLIFLVASLVGLGAVLISNFGTGRPWFGGRLGRPAPRAEQPPAQPGAA